MKNLNLLALLIVVSVLTSCTDNTEENVKNIEDQQSITKDDYDRDGDGGYTPTNQD